MRTTLTLDDDLLQQLRDRAHRERRSFKSVVNEVVRDGLNAGAQMTADRSPLTIEAEHRGFRPGIDVAKLNQLVDELEIDSFEESIQRDA